MKKIIFVCLGNICRSPAAEAIFLKIVADKKISSDFTIDSAGTSAHHRGGRADSRMMSHALKRGFDLQSISRQFKKVDLEVFDYIVVMDRSNYRDVLSIAPTEELRSKVVMMTDFSRTFPDVKEIPDPYYDGEKGFEHVLDLLEDSCMGLLEHLKDTK